MICDYEHEEQLDGGRFRRVTCQAKAEIGSLCYRHKFQAENKRLKDKIKVLELAADLTKYTKEQLQENEKLKVENKNWKARYIEAVNDMATLKRKIAKLEQAQKG